MGLCYLAAALRLARAQPQILDLAAEFPDYHFGEREGPLEKLQGVLSQIDPKLIGIGPLTTATLQPTQELLEVCRVHSRATLVVGGPLCAAPGISLVVGTYLDADAYVSGDGEGPILNLYTRALRGLSPELGLGIGLPGAPEPNPFREEDLDALPVPARDLLPYAYHASARRTLQGDRVTSAFLSRGCPYSCSFCAAPLSSGKRVRRFSAPRIAAELAACAAAGFGTVIFYDDCLFVRSPKLNGRVLEFCDALRASGWRGTYQLELRCDAVEVLSDETFEALVATGCRQVNMGIEKGHVAQLAQIRKRLSPDVARSACERVSAAGIRAAGTFIVGGVGESENEVRETIEFALSLPLVYAHFNPLAVYPGTQLFREVFPELPANRWLHLCLDDSIAPMGDILWRSKELPIEVSLKAVSEAYRQFYSADRLAWALGKAPSSEHEFIRSSYATLASERSHSWEQRGATVVLQC